MHRTTQVCSIVVSLGLIGLVITTGIAIHRVRRFSLPISMVTTIATIFLPVLTGISLREAQTRTRHTYALHADVKRSFSWSSFTVFILLVIYEAVIMTLALTYVTPSAGLDCRLESQWLRLFTSKNAEAIRNIQDRHQCCGLRSVADRAWPFPDRSHDARACAEAFNRQRSCLAEWRRDEQVTGSLLFLIAIVVFVMKLILLIVCRARNPFLLASRNTSSMLNETYNDGSGVANVEGRDHRVRGHIEGPYYDNPSGESEEPAVTSQGNQASDQRTGNGPVMQPSRLHGEGNEWRDA